MIKNILLLSLALIITGISPVLADESPVTRAESDYRFQFDQYRNAYQTYTISRNEYWANTNLKSEQDALDAAKTVTLARSDVLRAFGQWMRLQLLQYSTTYPQATTISNLLDTQNNWYLALKDKANAAGDASAFEKVQAQYTDYLPKRDKLNLQSEIELKLAWLNQQLLDSAVKFAPDITILQTKLNIPEVEQGLSKIKSLQDQVKTQIADTSKMAPGVDKDGRAMENTETIRNATQALDSIRTNLVSIVSLMKELEIRYVRPTTTN